MPPQGLGIAAVGFEITSRTSKGGYPSMPRQVSSPARKSVFNGAQEDLCRRRVWGLPPQGLGIAAVGLRFVGASALSTVFSSLLKQHNLMACRGRCLHLPGTQVQ
jgi:hypothetical protein